MSEIPVLDAHVVTHREGYQSLVVWCDHCLRFHIHGVGYEGHKGAHCGEEGSPYERKGYIIRRVEPDWTEAQMKREAVRLRAGRYWRYTKDLRRVRVEPKRKVDS